MLAVNRLRQQVETLERKVAALERANPPVNARSPYTLGPGDGFSGLKK